MLGIFSVVLGDDDVVEADAAQAEVVVPPTNQTLRLGQTATFYCEIEGDQLAGQQVEFARVNST